MNNIGRITAASAICEALLPRKCFNARSGSSMPLKSTPRPAGGMKLPGSIKQNGNGGSDSERDLRGFGIVDGQVLSGQMKFKKSGEEAPQVAQRLAHSLGPDDHEHSHEAVHEQGIDQHLNEPLPSEECAQPADQLPVASAQAADEHQRQQKAQSQGGS